MRIGIDKEIFNPSHITIWSNFVAAIAKRGSFVLVGLGEVKEAKSFSFQSGHEFHWNTMIDQFEEAILFTGLDYEGLCFRVP